MAITYTGSNGLFTRLGKLFYVREIMNTFQDNLRTEVEDVIDEFSSADLYQLGGLPSQIKTLDAPMLAIHTTFSAIARTMIIETVRAGLSYEPAGLEDALRLLVQDMVDNTKHVEDVNYSTSGTVGVGGLATGNGTMVVNSNLPKNISTGGSSTLWQTIKGEVVRVECVTDESGGATLGREVFRALGDEPVSPFDATWPAGSGCDKYITVTSAKSRGATRTFQPGDNLLANSDFQVWEAATDPGRWTATQMDSASVPANAQTNNTTAAYIWNSESGGNLQVLGDGTYRHRIYQEFGKGTGTHGRVLANKNYILSCRVRIAAGSGTVGGGALQFVIQDSAGNATSATKTLDLTSVGTSWTHVYQPWDLSETEIPTTARLALDFTTAIPNTKAIVIDELVLAERIQLYPGGPGFIIVRGSADYRTGDFITLTYAHSASPPVNEFQFFFDQLVGMSGFNLNLPIHTSENIADSLIA